jgi:hypothetical protein
MEISQDDYLVRFDPDSATLTCEGSFRLRGADEYAPILEILTAAADAKPETLTLDLRRLRFLNSSGINTLSKFVLQVRRHDVSNVVVMGSGEYPWQRKSLKNFQRLLPALKLLIE